MKKPALLIVLTVLFIQLGPVFAAGETSRPAYAVIEELDVKVVMRDGVRLSANIYRPQAPGEFPALLCRTPYGNGGPGHETGHFFAGKGYAVVIQDCRGRGESEGLFDPMQAEALDGIDTQQWVGSRPWCNGKIGTFGGSYVGFTQWISAPFDSPYLVAMVPVVTTSDFHGLAYEDGAFRMRLWESWGYWMTMPYDLEREVLNQRIGDIGMALPLIEHDRQLGWRVSFLRTWLSHPEPDRYWDRLRMRDGYGKIRASALNIGGWFDICLQGTLENFVRMTGPGIDPEVRSKQRLVVGPWVHGITRDGKVGELDFGPEAVLDLRDLELRWFDNQLYGADNGIDREPAVKIFVMGENLWRSEHEWPPARAEFRSYYFHGGGRANTAAGDGRLGTDSPAGEGGSDSFIYDPADPVPSNPDGGPFGGFDIGPMDYSRVEERGDVLVYSTPVLDRDLEATGPVGVVLFAATSALNTDFTARLLDVYPDGRAVRLCDGIVRASFRRGPEHPSNVEPGEVCEYRLDLRATSNLFRQGHRVRVEVSSSNFPRFDRNLNTGGDFAGDTTWVKAEQTVYHTARYPSCLVLPVIPR